MLLQQLFCLPRALPIEGESANATFTRAHATAAMSGLSRFS